MRLLWALGSLSVALAGLGGLWVMDTANTVATLSNGFWDLSSERGFHLGMWTAIVSIIALMFSVIALLFHRT